MAVKLGLDAFEPTVNLIEASIYGIDFVVKALAYLCKALVFATSSS